MDIYGRRRRVATIVDTFSGSLRTLGSQSQFTYICAGLSLPLNVESNRSWCWQSLLSALGRGTATSVPTNVTSIVAWTKNPQNPRDIAPLRNSIENHSQCHRTNVSPEASFLKISISSASLTNPPRCWSKSPEK